MKWGEGRVLSNEEIAEKIKETYRNLTDEELEVLVKYYQYMNTPQSVRGLSNNGKIPVLLIKNGKYIVVDIDKKYLEDTMTRNADVSTDGSLSVGKKMNSEVSGSSVGGKSISVGGNLYNFGNNDSFNVNVGNVSGSISADNTGISVSTGASLLEVSQEFITKEDDLYRYGGSVTVKVISAEISASLGLSGFDVGAFIRVNWN